MRKSALTEAPWRAAMKAVACAVVLFCLGLPSTFAVGFAHDETFIVYAPDQALADQVLAKAEKFRKAEAKDLLGEELEAGLGRTIITVKVSATEDNGFTWPIDHPDRKFHNVWLTTSRTGRRLHPAARDSARRPQHAVPRSPPAVD